VSDGAMADKQAIVVDNGTGFVKCGFADANFPAAVFPSMVGRPILRYEEGGGQAIMKDIMVGDEAAEHRNMLEIKYPVAHGIVQDWGDMRHIWDYTFNERLKINPRDCRIMLTEPPANPKSNREKMVQEMLEHYEFDGVYVGVQAVLTLYAQGVPIWPSRRSHTCRSDDRCCRGLR